MKQENITLSHLEKFLLKSTDTLRDKMNPSEFKKFIFRILFLKRFSDEFDSKREYFRKETFAHHPPDIIEELLEDKTSYGEIFFVSLRSCWNKPWKDDSGNLVSTLKDLKEDIGNMLNKTISAIEDENDEIFGVQKNNINFDAIESKTNNRSSAMIIHEVRDAIGKIPASE